MTVMIDSIRTKHPQHLFLIFVDGVLTSESDALLDAEFCVKQQLLRLPKNSRLKKPLHYIFIQTKNEVALNHKIILEEGSELCLIEECISSSGKISLSIDMVLHPNSKLDWYQLQPVDSTVQIKQLRDSKIERFSFMNEPAVSKEKIQVDLMEPGAECQLRGLYSLTNQQQIEHTLIVNHQAEHCQSGMLYKGILGGKSRAAFRGKVHVHPAAQKTQAYQANHHLLLTNEAEALSKPELEIYADDVKCTHGATTGQLDSDAFFYLRSRGIDQANAKQFLLNAFADEVINAVNNKKMSHYMSELFHV